MSSRWSIARTVLVVIALFAMPALACEFSVSTATITKAVMAEDVQGANLEPVNVTDTYSPDQQVFHAVVTIANAPSDTKVRAVWTAIDVGDAAQPNTVIDEAETTAEGSGNIDLTLTSQTGSWPAGTYKVDIYLNDKLDRTLNFSVEGGS
jgi:hypothetical protein